MDLTGASKGIKERQTHTVVRGGGREEREGKRAERRKARGRDRDEEKGRKRGEERE